MTIRLFVETPLAASTEMALPPGPARHAQVRRVQPGESLILFDGRGGEWRARVTTMGRSDVRVAVEQHVEVERELPLAVTLAVGMPANERMDILIEKATELGVAAVQPLLCERSVLRPTGERAERKREHWQAVAVAASEQCGRTRVPLLKPICALGAWLALRPASPAGWLLSPSPSAARPTRPTWPPSGPLVVLSGPEGGLSPAEEEAARAAGFIAISLGPRVLRAETAPLALLAWLGLVG